MCKLWVVLININFIFLYFYIYWPNGYEHSRTAPVYRFIRLDYLCVIGGGSGGIIVAKFAGKIASKVPHIEGSRIGGECCELRATDH